MVPDRVTRRDVREREHWLSTTPRARIRTELVHALRSRLTRMPRRRRRTPVLQLLHLRLGDGSIEAVVELRSRPAMAAHPEIRALLTWFDVWELRRLLEERPRQSG